MLIYIKTSVPEIIGTIIGAAAGFLYYKLIGCPTGSCPIISNPWSSTLLAAALGFVTGSMLNKNKK